MYLFIINLKKINICLFRVQLFFMPVKHYPPTPYVKRVPTWKIHFFTTLQVTCLATLWAVKSSKFSLAFPFFLILMVPIRQKLGSCYKPEELKAVRILKSA